MFGIISMYFQILFEYENIKIDRKNLEFDNNSVYKIILIIKIVYINMFKINIF